MSRSRKDGRRGGGHRNTQNREVWSKRCRKVSAWPTDDPWYKHYTHRYERRQARRAVHDALRSPSPEDAPREEPSDA